MDVSSVISALVDETLPGTSRPNILIPMSTTHSNAWKVAFWAQFVLFVAVLLAVLYGAYVRLANLQEARLKARGASVSLMGANMPADLS